MTEELELYQTTLGDYVTGLHWSKQDAIIAGCADGRVHIIDPTRQEKISNVLAHKGGVLTLDVSPSACQFASGGQDNTMKLCDCTGFLMKEIKMQHWVENIVWSPDGNFFAFTAGKVFVICDKHGNEVTRSESHASTVAAITWCSDSKRIASASYGGVRIYNLSNPGEFEQLIWKNSLISLTWSPDQRFIMAGTQDNSIHVWKMDTAERRDMAMHGYASKARAFAWDESGKKVATNCGLDIVIWDITRKNGPEETKPDVIDAHSAKVTTLAYQRGENLLTSGDESGRVYFWVSTKGKFQFITGCKLEGAVSSMRWNQKGSMLAVGTAEGVVSVLEY